MSVLLLVEDDECIRLTCSALLELEGHEVHECSTLAHARELVSRGTPYAAVLVDRRLPDGIGDSLIPLVRTNLPAARVIVTSGDLVGAEEIGADAHHGKGQDAACLVGLLNTLLEAR